MARAAQLLICMLLLSGCSDDSPTRDTTPTDTPAVPDAPAARAPAAPAQPPPPPPSVQDQYWQALTTLCGKAYAGYLTVGTEPGDRDFGEAEMTMHVRDCSESEIRIPFHVGPNRSRTWIVRRDGDGFTLKHHHRDESGAVAEPHDYGGRTAGPGSIKRQEFVVDEATRTKLPETRYNVWAIDVVPGRLFAYELQRPEEDRFFRVEFELASAIAAPPPAWGHSAD
jgi:DNA-dependent RNA polymerase auxiliary subunit epsilon